MLLASAIGCAVAAPGSWTAAALRIVGEDWDRLERAHATELRAPIARALAGVRTKPTRRNPDGVSRGALIRVCGRQHATMRGGAIGVEPRQCRQRPCPACARARARKNGHDVEAAMRGRSAERVAMLFVTLTQVKRRADDECARDAVRRLYDSWRLLVHGRAHRDGFASRFAGGLRTTETTWSPAGSEREHGGVVAFDGFHAHLHLLMEVRDGVSTAEAAAWLIGAWLECSPGASARPQVVKRANYEHAHQLAKYVSKPLEEYADNPGIVRALFGGLHGLRLLQAFGSWIGRGDRAGWRPKEPSESVQATEPPRRGLEVGELLRYVSNPIEGTTGRVPFVGAERDDVVWVDATHAWEAVERAFRDRIAARAPPVVHSTA